MKMKNLMFLAPRKSWMPYFLGPMKLAIVCFCILGFARVALAGPELPITRPPVVGNAVYQYTGPLADPEATWGQSFLDLATENKYALPVQFYDNPVGGGGGSKGTDAIRGVVSSYVLVGANITAFTIQATITYDMPALTGWPSGENALGETLTTSSQLNVVGPPTLTANFAISSLNNVPSSFTTPYYQVSPQIVAANNTALAWYGWTPGWAPTDEPSGGWYVPAWNNFVFDGTSWVALLFFTVQGAGLDPTDPRYAIIEASSSQKLDIFTSQSSSLKISNWESPLNVDQGKPYPTGQDLSDVSVFVPEPTTLTLLGVGTLSLLAYEWRRRKAKA